MSEGAIARAFVDVEPRVNGFRQNLSSEIQSATRGVDGQIRDGIERPVTRSAGRMRSVVGKEVKSMRGAVLGGLGAMAAVNLFKSSIAGASDLAEATSKVNTVFGNSAPAIREFAKSADAIGLSDRAATDALGTFGNMFNQLKIGSVDSARMSEQMVRLAADLGSFHNADITDVIAAQTSAFRGEYDALQRYIPTINAAAVEQAALAATGKKTTKELTAQEKALAVQSLMMSGAGKAAGDYQRTVGGLANSQRNLTADWEDAKDKLGTQLIPVMTTATQVATEKLLPAMTKTFEFIGEHGDVIKPLATVAVGLYAVNKAIKLGNAVFDSSIIKIGRRIAANRAQIASEAQVTTAVLTRNAAESGSGSLPGAGVPGAGGKGKRGPSKVILGLSVPATAIYSATAEGGRAETEANRRRGGDPVAQVLKERDAVESLIRANADLYQQSYEALDRADQNAIRAANQAGNDVTRKQADAASAAYARLVAVYQNGGKVIPPVTAAQRELANQLFRAGERAQYATTVGITPFQAALKTLAPRIADVRGQLNSAITPFDELPKRAAMSKTQLLKNLLSQEQDKRKLAANFKVLAQAGIGTPVLAHLHQLEQQSPGTVAQLVKGGISDPFAAELNTRFQRILGSNGDLAVWLAGVASQANINAAATSGRAIGTAFVREFTTVVDNTTVRVTPNGFIVERPRAAASVDRDLGRTASTRGAR